MKQSFETSYLNQKLEPSGPILEGVEVSDYRDFIDHSYELKEGKYELAKNGTRIVFAYSQPTVEELINEEQLAAKLLSHNGVTENDFADYESLRKKTEYIFDNIRVVKTLIFENKAGKYDIEEVFPEGKIFFNFQKDYVSSSGICLDAKQIFLTEDPLTPKGFVTLLHEIGHYKDSTEGDETAKRYIDNEIKMAQLFVRAGNKVKLKADVWERAAESVLGRERAAWAFALKDLKPFITDLEIRTDNLQDHIHGMCLKSYSTFIRNAIE